MSDVNDAPEREIIAADGGSGNDAPPTSPTENLGDLREPTPLNPLRASYLVRVLIKGRTKPGERGAFTNGEIESEIAHALSELLPATVEVSVSSERLDRD